MPTYRIKDPTTGQVVKLTGDSPPTEQELEEVFAKIGGGAPVAASPPDKIQLPESAPPPTSQGIIQDTMNQWTAPLPTRSPLEGKWWTENLPQSVGRIVPQAVVGAVAVPYNAAKKFTDPVYNALAGKQDIGSAASDLFYAPREAAKEFVGGVQEFVGGPLGLAKDKTMKEAWSDPAASVLALAPLAKGAGGAVAKIAPKPANVMERSLRFEPSVGPKLQERVAKTVLDEGVVTTKESYNNFVQKIEDQAKAVWDLIRPVAKEQVSPDIGKAQNEARSWAETSTDAGKNQKKIDSYFERFNEDHPTLTVEEAQKIKVNLNKDLTTYYKAIAKGEKAKIDPVIEAKKQLMFALRDVVDSAAPGTAEINANISDLMVAKPFLKVAMNKAESRPLFDSSSYHAGVIGGFAGGALDGYTGAGIGSPAAMIATRLLTDQKLQSKAAQAMRRFGELLSPKEAEALDARLWELEPKPERGFTMRSPEEVYSPYSPELAARRNQLALPAPVREFEMRNPEDVYSPYSPELAAKRNQLALPAPERGFGMRNPEEVYSPYSPEFAAQVPTTKALPPGAPKEIFREANSMDRLFQIAQSPEGMRLLREKLGREEKFAEILDLLSGASEYNLLEYSPNTDMKQTKTWYLNKDRQIAPKVQEYQILPSGYVRQIQVKPEGREFSGLNPLGQ